MTVEVRLVDPGRPIEYRGRIRHAMRRVTIDRVWHVYLDGEPVGAIAYVMRTRETRTRGRTYVNTRWQSPAWMWTARRPDPNLPTPYFNGAEAYSKADAVERILRDHERSTS